MNRAMIVAIGVVVLLQTRSVWGQVVQLPTYRQFSVGTSVLIPDSGSVYLGGVRRSSVGSVSRGIPGTGRFGSNRAIGRSDMATGVSVTATIIDHREWDEAILAEAAARRTAANHPIATTTLDPEAAQRAARLARFMGRQTANSGR